MRSLNLNRKLRAERRAHKANSETTSVIPLLKALLKFAAHKSILWGASVKKNSLDQDFPFIRVRRVSL